MGYPDRSARLKLASPLLKAAQVKSWKALSSGTVSVGARRLGQTIRLIPKESRGKGGFVQLLCCELTVPADSPDEVGVKLREGLALAR